jgi:CRISPR/Cas system CSM-associated protein Csm3 (group 7 of RAMP superfamily)
MSHNDRPEERGPKPFAFVPFARVQQFEGAGHQKLDLAGRYSGQLAFRLETLTPLFVGTGNYALGKETGFPEEKVVRPFYRVNHVPTIPGSSLKGLARSIAEAVSPSCVTVSRINPTDLPKGVSLATSRRNDCTTAKACPACSIFGRMSQYGKARFGDARLLGAGKTALFQLSPLFAPRALGSQGRKFYFHSEPEQDPRQPPVEVIPPGQRLQAQVDFENLSPAELGLLCFALGVDRALTLKLGGGKPMGLGSLKVVWAELVLLGTNHYTQADSQETRYTGQALAELMGKLTDAALRDKVLLRSQASALADILDANKKRAAPTGAY